MAMQKKEWQARRYIVGNKQMTVREIMRSPSNVYNLNDGQIRGRLAAGNRTLANILRPIGTAAASEAVTYEKTPEQEETYVSDGSTANYYLLPDNAKELQDLISHKNMNAQIGEIFRACYRYGEVKHSSQLRDAKKMLYYAQAEVKRLGG